MQEFFSILWAEHGVKVRKFVEWQLITLDWGEKVVLKEWDELSREHAFYSFISDHSIAWFPRLIEADRSWKSLLLSYCEGINGKEVVDSILASNWVSIWRHLWTILHELHAVSTPLSDEQKNIWIQEMLDYMSVDSKIFDQIAYDLELNRLQKMISKTSQPFVMLHGDFSPHNCLFYKNEHGEYRISTVLDPSARVTYGVKYFDIAYLLNTRWNRNTSETRAWFLESYPIDLSDPLFLQFEKIMRMYLAEIYSIMWDARSAENMLYNLRD